MNLYHSSVAAAVFVWAISPLAAQWVNYPTAGIPRTADGKPNLAASAPRTADGKPDLSGIWEIDHQRPPAALMPLDAPVGEEFVNLAWSLRADPPYQPWALELMKKRSTENRVNDPYTHCMPPGAVRMHTTPGLRKVIQLPGLLVILSEINSAYRQIFTDGRPLPVDPLPSWNGYSSGKWEGDTLVVQTNGFRDGMWLDAAGHPSTDAAKITERFRRVNFGNLEIEVTVDDPKAYTKPWTVKLNQTLRPDTDMVDYICLENEKDIEHFVK
jgi:hypothetical protein